MLDVVAVEPIGVASFQHGEEQKLVCLIIESFWRNKSDFFGFGVVGEGMADDRPEEDEREERSCNGVNEIVFTSHAHILRRIEQEFVRRL